MPRHLDQRLKLRQLRALDAVATHKSLLKASKALGITQPALTRTIQELEAVLDAKLFERHARGVRLTVFGEMACLGARRILAELVRLEEDIDRLSSATSGTVSVGALPTAAVGLLPGVLTRLRTGQPNLAVRLVEGRTEELLPLLAAGELDLIVGRLYQPSVPDQFHREPLYDEPLSVLARPGHPILGQSRITPADIARFELILPTVSQRVGQEIEHLLAKLALPPANRLRSSSVGFIREMLLGTDSLTMGPRMMMGSDLLRGTIALVPLTLEQPPRPAGLILNAGRPMLPSVETLIAGVRAYLAEMVAGGLIYKS